MRSLNTTRYRRQRLELSIRMGRLDCTSHRFLWGGTSLCLGDRLNSYRHYSARRWRKDCLLCSGPHPQKLDVVWHCWQSGGRHVETSPKHYIKVRHRSRYEINFSLSFKKSTKCSYCHLVSLFMVPLLVEFTKPWNYALILVFYPGYHKKKTFHCHLNRPEKYGRE